MTPRACKLPPRQNTPPFFVDIALSLWYHCQSTCDPELGGVDFRALGGVGRFARLTSPKHPPLVCLLAASAA